jgi:hypothetical protein
MTMALVVLSVFFLITFGWAHTAREALAAEHHVREVVSTQETPPCVCVDPTQKAKLLADPTRPVAMAASGRSARCRRRRHYRCRSAARLPSSPPPRHITWRRRAGQPVVIWKEERKIELYVLVFITSRVHEFMLSSFLLHHHHHRHHHHHSFLLEV